MTALAGRRIVVPETREIDILAGMLEKQGAAVVRCPLVAIRDAADPAPVLAWIERFIAAPPDDLILFTGEGLQRLIKLAGPAGLSETFTAALAGVRKITRGPKPARRLRDLGLRPDLAVEPPTTAGIIAALSQENLAGRRIAVQLYPDAPDDLQRFSERCGRRGRCGRSVRLCLGRRGRASGRGDPRDGGGNGRPDRLYQLAAVAAVAPGGARA